MQLYEPDGRRKYLTPTVRQDFIQVSALGCRMEAGNAGFPHEPSGRAGQPPPIDTPAGMRAAPGRAEIVHRRGRVEDGWRDRDRPADTFAPVLLALNDKNAAVDVDPIRAHLKLVRKWLGHAQLATIYANASGPGEKRLAERMWT
jgi:hypothetical protein